MILLTPSPEDLIKLEPILLNNPRFVKPNMKISVYKNRRGSYTGCYLWAYANLGTCRIIPQFCTTWRHEILPIENLQIEVEDKGAF